PHWRAARQDLFFADSLRARDEEDTVVAQQIETWVTFSLAGEVFALPVEPIREVLRVSGITRVPHAPHPIRGVSNLRGRVIPVIDLRQRIELPVAEVDRNSRILVVSSRGRLLGLLVDSVHQVIHLDFLRVQPPPQDVVTAESGYILGVYQVGEQLILLLDADRVLILHEGGTA
ncbi:MAG: purine-binding chemotaxis protein CheW, partial [Thermoanaerobaculia bacterium]|nr:purine-binding chemotaxis protein CheW [Thermoanaerobaculia bacterium]